MKKSTIAIALVIVFLVIVGSAVWLSLNKPSNTADTSTSGTPSNNTGAQTQNAGNMVDMTNKSNVDVAMRDLSYSPSSIKVKKGTTVTWTNNDTVGHNVVAAVPSSSGGLPTSHALFGKGETFSHKFETAGTFAYFCTPHPFMKGTVEVVE